MCALAGGAAELRLAATIRRASTIRHAAGRTDEDLARQWIWPDSPRSGASDWYLKARRKRAAELVAEYWTEIAALASEFIKGAAQPL